MRLPGGFSPTQALRQFADTANPFDGTNTDYNVFSDVSFQGGVREPTETQGGLVSWGPEGSVQSGWTPSNNGGYNYTGVLGESTGGGGNSGGGGGNTTQRQAPVDPYARWGGQAAFNALQEGINSTQQGYKKGAQTSLRDVGNEYDQKTRNFLNTIEAGQGEINRGGAQNQLNLRQSMQNIIRGIQQGVRSGGVALAGVNAMDSGAADAMGRAYAKVGNQQTGEARGEAAGVFEELQRSQGALNRQKDEGISDIDTWGDTETDRVKSDLSTKLSLLQADAQSKGLGGVDMKMVDAVVGEAVGRLAQIDQTRQQRLGGIKQWTPEQIMQEAIRMEQQGAVGNAFSVTGPEVNYNGNGGGLKGAPMGQLPIYVRNRDEQAQVPGIRGEDEKNRVV